MVISCALLRRCYTNRTQYKLLDRIQIQYNLEFSNLFPNMSQCQIMLTHPLINQPPFAVSKINERRQVNWQPRRAQRELNTSANTLLPSGSACRHLHCAFNGNILTARNLFIRVVGCDYLCIVLTPFSHSAKEGSATLSKHSLKLSVPAYCESSRTVLTFS